MFWSNVLTVECSNTTSRMQEWMHYGCTRIYIHFTLINTLTNAFFLNFIGYYLLITQALAGCYIWNPILIKINTYNAFYIYILSTKNMSKSFKSCYIIYLDSFHTMNVFFLPSRLSFGLLLMCFLSLEALYEALVCF
jgi:hypothetical protein